MPLNFGDMGKESIFAVLTLIQRQTEACQERAIFLIAQPQIIAALYPRVVPLMRPQPAFDDSVSDGKGKAVFILPVMPKSLIMATNNSHAHTGRTILVTTTSKITGKGQIYFVNKFIEENKLQQAV